MQLYDLGSVSVLVVDDNRFMRNIVANTLNGIGVRSVAQADSVDQALEQLAEIAVDLVISDWDMGEKSGIELIRRIRANKSMRLLPIIMLTANTTRTNIFTARDAGVTEFLAKPISAQALYGRVVEVIERPRQFVKTKSFFGPDRRRRRADSYRGPKRRKEDQ
ncbi:response regulator [Ferrovibrio sp. MS7]|jgi:two-component system chemotaxis response regulator CheY|uniref:response regulator n=1 Tax=Ferrovibrio plantarum TaxID=3119164 RepID=UPI001B59A7B9|nr:response regulator [Ferrovibrio sp.]